MASRVTELDPERVKEEIQRRLIGLVGRYAVHVSAHYRVELGNVPSAILRVASEIDCNFIVLGLRRSSGVLDPFMWPIAYEVGRTATCPVLTMRGSGPIR